MKRKFSTGLLLFLFCLPPSLIYGQENGDSIILAAMKDEMEDNMGQLHQEEFEKPFFISYTLTDFKTYQGTATFGALVYGVRNHFRGSGVRVMIGDYQISDENFTDQSNPIKWNNGNIPLPLTNDYWGIRRSFWFTTDNVYKAAGATYKNKIKILENSKTPNDFEPIADLSREPVIHKNIDRKEFVIDKDSLDTLIRDLSSVLADYTELTNSSVNLSVRKAEVYFCNSEGTVVRFPSDYTRLRAAAECFNDGAYRLYNYIEYVVPNPTLLPGKAKIESDIRAMVDSLQLLSHAPFIQENYFGPVLFLNDASADIFTDVMAGRLNFLIANRPELVSDSRMNLYYGTSRRSNEAAINQKVLPRNYSIRALAHLKKYSGTDLVGNFQIDAEGVEPPEDLQLVDRGILVNQLNGRTPTKSVPQSNGHNRFSEVCPGVLDIQIEDGLTKEQLKKELLEIAREENLTHVFILKKGLGSYRTDPILLYRVDVQTGKEELVNFNGYLELPENALRQIRASSSGRSVVNVAMGSGQGYSMNGSPSADIAGRTVPAGIPVSYILPDGVLLENVSLQKVFNPVSLKPPVVPSPVSQSQYP